MLLPKHITNEQTGIRYTLHGDYYLPDLNLSELEDNRPIGRWGRMHESDINKNKKHVFDSLIMSGKLHSYLANIDEQACDMFNTIIEQMKEAEDVTEQLKEDNQLEWVHRIDNIQAQVREIICEELIYV